MEQFFNLMEKSKEEIKFLYDGLIYRKRYLMNDIKDTEKQLNEDKIDHMRIKELKDDIRDSKLELAGIEQKLNKLVNYASLKGIELGPKEEEKPKLIAKTI